MPDSPNSSFIPRQGSAKRSRQAVSRQVYVFTVLSYIFFFGTLAASAGVFLYHGYLERQLRSSVVTLDAAIANFSTENMEQVKAFNTRLQFAQDRFENSVSIASIFESLEASTAQASELDSLTVKRMESNSSGTSDMTGQSKPQASGFLVTAEITANDFDSVLFQRGLYERNPLIEQVIFEDVTLDAQAGEQEVSTPKIAFTAELQVPFENVLIGSIDTPEIPATVDVIPVATSSEVLEQPVSTSTESNNDTSL